MTPAPAAGRPPVVFRGCRSVPVRRAVAVVLGYLALSPLVGMALAVEFDTPRPPAEAVLDRATGPAEAVLDDVARVGVPPGVARLRELSTPGGARRGRWASTPR